ncbi:transposase [Gordonibacter sp.]|nr:transposase [Gordonibacter sp.]
MTYEVRNSLRLRSWDYSNPGCYFVTACTFERLPLFGYIEVIDEGFSHMARMRLSDQGRLCKSAILSASETYGQVDVDTFVVMPNHIHLLVHLQDSLQDGTPRSLLSRFVGFIKGRVTREARKTWPEAQIWQKYFYDHVVRDEADYLRIWEYIENNPARWAQDRYWFDEGDGQ